MYVPSRSSTRKTSGCTCISVTYTISYGDILANRNEKKTGAHFEGCVIPCYVLQGLLPSLVSTSFGTYDLSQNPTPACGYVLVSSQICVLAYIDG